MEIKDSMVSLARRIDVAYSQTSSILEKVANAIILARPRTEKDLEEVLAAVDEWVGSKDIYIHLTDIEKLGINPRTEYNTPVGIYAYPLTEKIYKDFSNGSLPYRNNSKFVFLFKVKSTEIYDAVDSFILDNVLDAIVIFAQRSNPLFAGIPKSEVEYQLLEVADQSKLQTGIGRLWNVTRVAAGEGNATKWNILLRQIGLNGITDLSERGLIHPQEPTQAVFFSREVIEWERLYTNPLKHDYSVKYIDTTKLSLEDVNRILKTRGENGIIQYLPILSGWVEDQLPGSLSPEDAVNVLSQNDRSNFAKATAINYAIDMDRSDLVEDFIWKGNSIQSATVALRLKGIAPEKPLWLSHEAQLILAFNGAEETIKELLISKKPYVKDIARAQLEHRVGKGHLHHLAYILSTLGIRRYTLQETVDIVLANPRDFLHFGIYGNNFYRSSHIFPRIVDPSVAIVSKLVFQLPCGLARIDIQSGRNNYGDTNTIGGVPTSDAITNGFLASLGYAMKKHGYTLRSDFYAAAMLQDAEAILAEEDPQGVYFDFEF